MSKVWRTYRANIEFGLNKMGIKGITKYTKSYCKKEVSKYQSVSELRDKNPTLYTQIIKRGFGSLLRRLDRKIKPSGHWTREAVKKEALKYNTRTEFRERSLGAYQAAKKLGILDKVCSHMKQRSQRPPNFWKNNRNKIPTLIKRYKTRSNLIENEPGLYNYLRVNHLLNNYFPPSKMKNKPRSYWNKITCKEEALQYDLLKDFRLKSRVAYQVAKENKWLPEITKHMKNAGSLKKRAVYAFEFPKKIVYVGITWNYEIRYRQHMNGEGKAGKEIVNLTKKHGHTFVQFNDFMEEQKAREEEERIKEAYVKKGWTILNIAPTGSLGRSTQTPMSKKIALEVVSKVDNVKDLREKYPTEYTYLCKKKLLKKHTKHLSRKTRGKNSLTLKHCIETAKKYETRNGFCLGSPSEYYKCVRKGWLNRVCGHMAPAKKN